MPRPQLEEVEVQSIYTAIPEFSLHLNSSLGLNREEKEKKREERKREEDGVKVRKTGERRTQILISLFFSFPFLSFFFHSF